MTATTKHLAAVPNPNPNRDTRGHTLNWHQRRFLNTHGTLEDHLWVDSMSEDGEAYILRARDGRLIHGYIVELDGSWRVVDPPDLLAVVIEIGLAGCPDTRAIPGLF